MINVSSTKNLFMLGSNKCISRYNVSQRKTKIDEMKMMCEIFQNYNMKQLFRSLTNDIHGSISDHHQILSFS